MLCVRTAVTEAAVTVNVAEVTPCGTTTFGGTVAVAVDWLDSVTVAPPAGAGPLSRTVAVEVPAEMTLAGFNVTE
jgi:hypothetical protein